MNDDEFPLFPFACPSVRLDDQRGVREESVDQGVMAMNGPGALANRELE